jgi:diazepam-binding inhibitor (GABA receptor modulating acyl-CoA-binding protein)
MSLDEKFQQAKEKINSLPAQDNENLLKMYSLYKQATVGDVSGKKPGMFDLIGKAKYDAWETLKGMTQDQAKQSYINLVDELAKA